MSDLVLRKSEILFNPHQLGGFDPILRQLLLLLLSVLLTGLFLSEITPDLGPKNKQL